MSEGIKKIVQDDNSKRYQEDKKELEIKKILENKLKLQEQEKIEKQLQIEKINRIVASLDKALTTYLKAQ
jgi:hypothetical protein